MGFYTEKTEISHIDYLRLLGLLTIARDLNAQLVQIGKSVAGILGEQPGDGHAEDAVYSNYSVDGLLAKSGIIALPPEPSESGS